MLLRCSRARRWVLPGRRSPYPPPFCNFEVKHSTRVDAEHPLLLLLSSLSPLPLSLPAPPQCEVEWVDAEHPLFLLYTSGSTGKPKGVVHATGALGWDGVGAIRVYVAVCGGALGVLGACAGCEGRVGVGLGLRPTTRWQAQGGGECRRHMPG